ncbi:MAG: hypothetical protein JXM69_01745 [Anaerolineae bacterium]|nr:hypothetical protein [Anaerolineae bacterium]
MAENTNHQPNIEVVRDLLSPYLDGEVTAQERALVEQTVATSPELRDELESLRQTVALVGSLPQVPAPRPFTLTEAGVGAVSAPRKFFRLPGWAGGLAAVATLLICVLAAGGLLLSGPLRGSLPQWAAPAEIAQFAAEAPVEESMVEEAAPPAEAQATAVVEQKIGGEKAAETEVPAETPPPAPAVIEEAAKAEEAPAGEAVEDTAALATAAESAPAEEPAAEAEAERDEDTERAAAPHEVMMTATPLPMPTSTMAAAMAAPATELAEDQVAAEEGLAEPPTNGETLAAQPRPDLSQKEGNFQLVEIKNQVLRITPGLIYLAGTVEVDPGTGLLATIQRNGAAFDHWANPATLQTVVQAGGQFAFNIQAATPADQDLFALEPASYQITITSTSAEKPVIALAYFDTFGPPAPAATAPPTATALPSPTLVTTRLAVAPTTTVPMGAETLGAVTAAEEAPPSVGVVTGTVIVLGVGLLIVMGVVIWLVIRRVIRHRK